VNQRIAPIKTTTNDEIFPIKIRKSQISAKYPAIKFAKSTSGLRIWKNITLTSYNSQVPIDDIKS
jgi:hypothetical protein